MRRSVSIGRREGTFAVAAAGMVLGWLVPVSGLWGFEELTPKQEESIQKGGQWLLKAQNRDGSWGMDHRTPADIGCTAMAGLTLLAGGHTGRGGPSADSIHSLQRSLDYILKRARQAPRGAGIADGEVTQIHQYVGQGAHTFFAVIFLSQVYGMTGLGLGEELRDEIRVALARFAAVIAAAQEADGSWHKETYSSLQATALAWLALRSTSSCGLPIQGAAVQKTLRFIEQQYNPSTSLYDGSRMEHDNGTRLIYASSSAIRILAGMGRTAEREPDAALELLLKKMVRGPWGHQFLTHTGEDYPAALMLTQALLHENGPRWETWFPYLRERLLAIQNADGSWTATSCLRGRTFVTACAILSLQAPYRLLPLQEL